MKFCLFQRKRTAWNRPKEEWDELDQMTPTARETIIAMRNDWEYRTGLPAVNPEAPVYARRF